MQYGRKAFGPHRKRSSDTLAHDIAHSILVHRARGIERTPEFYRAKGDLKAKVEAILKQNA